MFATFFVKHHVDGKDRQRRMQDITNFLPTQPRPRPLFIYGTLRAMPLLAWALTGDATHTQVVKSMARPATVKGYTRFALSHRDYPAVVPSSSPDSSVDGYLLELSTTSQRRKLDDFEGETYVPTPVSVQITESQEIVSADMYVWAGDMDEVSMLPWSLEKFIQERLDDWLELFGGMELVGEDED